MTIHETRTLLTPEEVIERAQSFFTHAGSPYAAFTEHAGSGFLKMRMDEGEIVIAALTREGFTWVRGSASRGGHLLTRFLTRLALPSEAKQKTNRYGSYRMGGTEAKRADDQVAGREANALPRARAA